MEREAWEQLLKQEPDNDDLRYIIYNGTEPWKEKAKAELKRREK